MQYQVGTGETDRCFYCTT